MNKSKSWILLMFCFLLTVSAYGQTRKPVRKSVTRTARVAKPVRKVTSTSTKTTATTVAPVMEKDVWTGKREVTIPGSVGKLAATLQVPEMKQGAKVPLVILMHGLGSDKDNMLFAALADSLQASHHCASTSIRTVKVREISLIWTSITCRLMLKRY